MVELCCVDTTRHTLCPLSLSLSLTTVVMFSRSLRWKISGRPASQPSRPHLRPPQAGRQENNTGQ